ncbi:Vesicle coat protein involved in Golgi to plasma membrane transport family protein [Candida albicans]|uniref:Vesicle coat protein involved in Golgi to plasma membrane transport family protein n=1 Tax=Candida albicans TaxID=5476 RepID=A0A8H6F612_CANAX|nr:Vesicle coat protein involved in Golgi to plasma membrane transport family protein [Candida albicans]
MKSLSVETMSDLSKPMFYGDAINGYCINQIFKVEDLNARGGERKYSLMVISDNESELLMRWEIVSIYFNVVIELIQKKVAKANQVKQSEKYLRRSLIKPKSLTELTNDNEIFVRIHLCVTEMLKDILG